MFDDYEGLGSPQTPQFKTSYEVATPSCAHELADGGRLAQARSCQWLGKLSRVSAGRGSVCACRSGARQTTNASIP